MIPTKLDIEIQGSLPGEDVQMTLDANSLAHLMSVLTNLYSDKTLAIVREYSTNALDSHIEAGVDRPIEVSTPSDFKPFFTVRDYGVGMDAETIRDIYSRYGASTKRGTNSQNGMLGLGSKSALTYTTQFKVTGVKDGVKTFVVVSRAADGSGVMKIISQTETNEHNGVTIEIPVANRREIENVAYNFFQFWKPGTVLLNGKDPSVVDGTQIGDFIVSQNINGDFIVMGNVAYPVPQNDRIFSNYNYSKAGVVAHVEMGEVNFTPSREALHLTSLTKDTLVRLRKEFTEQATKYVSDKISQSVDHGEALKNWYEIQSTSLSPYAKNAQYKGKDIPNHVNFRWLYRISVGTTYEASNTEVKRLVTTKVLIIHSYEYQKVHSAHRQKIKLWLDANGMSDVHFVYLTKDIPMPEWLASVPSIHWDDVKSMKIDRPKTDSVKDDLFDMINSRGYRISNQKVDDKKTIIYSSPTTFASDESRDLVARFLTNKDDVQLVMVNKNKWGTFKKEFPKALYIDDAVIKMLDDYVANLTEEEKLYLKSNWQDRNFCARLNSEKILDPVIKEAVKSLSVDGLSDKTTAKYELMQTVAYRWGYKNFPRLAADWQDRLFDQYPLLDVYGHRDLKRLPMEHIYLYMNNCYSANLINYKK
jgi:hypothetical protein